MLRTKIKSTTFLMLVMSMFCIPLTSRATITYSHSINETDLNIYEISAPDGTVFLRISGDDMFGDGEVGHPEIPYKVVRFLVPDNAYDFSVEIVEMDNLSTIELGNKIYPNQQPVSINDYTDDMFTYADEETYEKASSSFRAEVLEESCLEGRYHIVSIGLWPFAYTGTSNQLEICKSMRIKLDYKENSLFKQKSATSNIGGFVNISDIVVNANSELYKINTFTDGDFTSPISSDKIGRYYIISEKSLLPALKDLATWKTQKGYYVVTKAIEDIYSDSRYKIGTNGIVDEAASLRKYLQDEFNSYGTFFCFLVGDHRTKMPIRKVYYNDPQASSEEINGDKYVPTDNYFTDLSDDGWELRYEKGIYLADESSSCQPYIYVGRLLCWQPQEVYNYLKKLVLYETNPGRGVSDYLNKATLTVMYDGKGVYNNVLKNMQLNFNSVDCLLDCKISNFESKGYPPGNLILEKLNESGYCSWIGHGEPGTVACSGALFNKYDPNNTGSDKWEYIKALTSYTYNPDLKKSQTWIKNVCNDNGLDQITNYDSPSVVYTLACTTCPYDVYVEGELEFNLPHTMASSYTVSGLYGGVAYLGNTRKGYFGYSDKLEVLFLNNIKSSPKIGIVEAISKNNYIGDNKYIHHVRQTHNLIGDPEFELWTCKPKTLTALVSWDDTNISVSGSDAAGSTIVINDGNGKLRCMKFNSSQQSPVGYSGSGKMEALGVYKTGYLPIVTINCFADQLSNCNKNFVVRSAELGNIESRTVLIGSGAEVDIRAVDSIEGGSGLTISNNGDLTLRCDKQVSLSGSAVTNGGALTVKGEKVVMSNGFSVKAGGTLSINGI